MVGEAFHDVRHADLARGLGHPLECEADDEPAGQRQRQAQPIVERFVVLGIAARQEGGLRGFDQQAEGDHHDADDQAGEDAEHGELRQRLGARQAQPEAVQRAAPGVAQAPRRAGLEPGVAGAAQRTVALSPPSTTISAPVTYFASSEAR